MSCGGDARYTDSLLHGVMVPRVAYRFPRITVGTSYRDIGDAKVRALPGRMIYSTTGVSHMTGLENSGT